MQHNLIVILGPTASGKTKLAVRLADTLQTEIISADSRQVYKQMSIGTGKDLSEYTISNHSIPYHLIDIVPAGTKYHIHQFTLDFFNAFTRIQSRGKIPVLCGGTGLYIDAVLNNYTYTGVPVNEPLRRQLSHLSKNELEHFLDSLPKHPHHQTIDRSTSKRLIRGIEIITYVTNNTFDPVEFPEIKPFLFGLHLPVEQRRKNIETRLQFRLQNGLLEEVEVLLQTLTKEQLLYYGLEYKFITLFLTGELGYDEMYQQLLTAIHQYAKRQMTYFRKMEKDGKKIHWIEVEQPVDKQLEMVTSIIRAQTSSL